ncbi:Zn-dependent hydrolase [Candidatus Saccharibacteria bacterium]|nr:Zn-dependent hydrolase [Candidatus Saccharibacteria bacterium]
MLEIEYKGGNSVNLTTKDMQLWIDANVAPLGLKMGKPGNVVYLATEKRFLPDVDPDSLQLEGPGEYEVGPFAISGAAVQRHIDTENERKQSAVYHIDVGDIRIGIVGNVATPLSEEQLETIGVVDILILPVGGNGYTLDAKSAVALVAQVEPKIALPIHYADPAIKYEVPQDDVDSFISELGAPVEQVDSKLKIKSTSSIPAVLTTVVVSRS